MFGDGSCLKSTHDVLRILIQYLKYLMLFDLAFLSQQWLIDIAFATVLMRFQKNRQMWEVF